MRHLATLTLLLAAASSLAKNSADDDRDNNPNNNEKNDRKKTPAPSPFPSPLPSLSLQPVLAVVNNSSINATQPTTSPSVTAHPTQSSEPSLHPSISPSTSLYPSAWPSSIPSTTPTDIPSLSPSSSSQPSAAPWTYSRPPRIDTRYTPWLSLDETTKAAAENLYYDAYTWANYGTNTIEYSTWEMLDEAYRGNATILGYDSRSWDCWQNHYESYRWIDLPSTHIQVFQFFEVLGYDIDYWNGYTNNTESRSEDRFWYELSGEERYAASQLCFMRRSWDEEDILFNNMFPMVKPSFRFLEWDLLQQEQQEAAIKLGYNNVTWNVLGLNVVEERPW